jgi:glycosyltransferase involved in cell wall biosynthesis
MNRMFFGHLAAREPPMDRPPAISTVIRTFNSAKTLEPVLQRLGCKQDHEIIIVDSGSRDRTLQIAAGYGAKVVHFCGPFNYSRSLNLGFGAAKSPWVLVLSSHCIPLSTDYLADWQDSIATFPAGIGVAYGDCLLIESANRTDREAAKFFTKPEWERKPERLGGNTNALYRLDCWRQHPFDESMRTAEDLEWFFWALRSGYGAAQIPELAVLYRNQGSLRLMFVKGFYEYRASQQILGVPRMSFSELSLGVGSFAKKALLRRIPFGTALRQSSHQLGAFLGSLGRRKGPSLLAAEKSEPIKAVGKSARDSRRS